MTSSSFIIVPHPAENNPSLPLFSNEEPHESGIVPQLFFPRRPSPSRPSPLENQKWSGYNTPIIILIWEVL
jgi:hypothetical protein